MQYVVLQGNVIALQQVVSTPDLQMLGSIERTQGEEGEMLVFGSDAAVQSLNEKGLLTKTLPNKVEIDSALNPLLYTDAAPDKLLFLAIEFTGSFSAISATGFTSTCVLGNIAYGSIPVSSFGRLVKHPNILRIEKRRRAEPILNRSIPEMNVSGVRSRTGDVFSGWTGKSVIVGIIDTGIDITHKNFQKPDGTTRIVAIWDQTLTPIAGESHPEPITDPVVSLGNGTDWKLDYGVVYDEAAINEGTSKVRHRDNDGHGTHVAGAAAGNGYQSGGPEECHLNYRYIGVAPEADIMVVRQWGLSGEAGNPPTSNGVMIDAIGYIIQEARKRQQPVVINLSQASKTSLRSDGTAADSKIMDRLLKACSDDIAANPNARSVAIVAGSGNYGTSQYHCSTTVPANNASIVKLKFTLKSDENNNKGIARTINILFSAPGLEIQLTSPLRDASNNVTGDSMITWTSATKSSNTANGANAFVVVGTNSKFISIFLKPPANQYNLEGTWLIELRNPGAADIKIDAFCIGVNQSDAQWFAFTGDYINPLSTLSEEASTAEVLSAGGYTGSYFEAKPGARFQPGTIADFSGRGPTLDCLYETDPAKIRVKPEVAAPAVDIISSTAPRQRHDFCDINLLRKLLCDCCQDYYSAESGTSFSSPLVAGLVALLMQQNGRANHTKIKDAITGGAIARATGADPIQDYGWGKGQVNAPSTFALFFSALPAPVPVPEEKMAEQPDRIRTLVTEFFNTPFGLDLQHLSTRFFNEIRSLINTNKRVATVWHRIKGPAWLKVAMRAISYPAQSIPVQVEGQTLPAAIEKLSAMLNKYGSVEIQQFLERYENQMRAIAGGENLQEMLHTHMRSASSSVINPI